jgi:hypothetical protein
MLDSLEPRHYGAVMETSERTRDQLEAAYRLLSDADYINRNRQVADAIRIAQHAITLATSLTRKDDN